MQESMSHTISLIYRRYFHIILYSKYHRRYTLAPNILLQSELWLFLGLEINLSPTEVHQSRKSIYRRSCALQG